MCCQFSCWKHVDNFKDTKQYLDISNSSVQYVGIPHIYFGLAILLPDEVSCYWPGLGSWQSSESYLEMKSCCKNIVNNAFAMVVSWSQKWPQNHSYTNIKFLESRNFLNYDDYHLMNTPTYIEFSQKIRNKMLLASPP